MKDKIRTSVVNVQNLLVQAVAQPEKWLGDHELISAISSQGALASYSDSSRGIVRMSLNTFIKHSNSLAGGFKGIDELRSELKILLAKKIPVRAKKESRRSIVSERQHLEKLLKLQDLALHGQVNIIQRLMELASVLATADLPSRTDYYNQEIKFIRAALYHHGWSKNE